MNLPHVRDLPKVMPDFRRGHAGGRSQTTARSYAHATMASFLSRRNDRPDGYGGSPANRVKLPLGFRESDAVGTDYAVGCRFLAEECIEGGSTVGLSYYAAEFARLKMDFLSLSRGGRFEAKQPGIGEAAYPTRAAALRCMPAVLSDQSAPMDAM